MPASAAAKVSVSMLHSRLFSSPPKPFQRAIGRMNSRPARSAMRALAAMPSQVAGHRSGTLVSARPPSALVENRPSLKRFGPCIGWVMEVSLRGMV